MNAAHYRKLNNRQPGECTWCGKAVGKGRRTWCSADCVEQFREAYDWPYIRRKVELRDKGVCANCGCDTKMIQHVLWKLRERCRSTWWWMVREVYFGMGFPRHYCRDWWEADHIKPRILGGGNELENLRTLCVPCHKAETAKLAAMRAAKGGRVDG